MTLLISTSLATRLRDELRQHPLHDGEIRRIVGMGNHFIAKDHPEIGERGLSVMFTLTIDETAYVVGQFLV